jgi:hypothetical protein
LYEAELCTHPTLDLDHPMLNTDSRTRMASDSIDLSKTWGFHLRFVIPAHPPRCILVARRSLAADSDQACL